VPAFLFSFWCKNDESNQKLRERNSHQAHGQRTLPVRARLCVRGPSVNICFMEYLLDAPNEFRDAEITFGICSITVVDLARQDGFAPAFAEAGSKCIFPFCHL
jgi:hypothetical protein